MPGAGDRPDRAVFSRLPAALCGRLSGPCGAVPVDFRPGGGPGGARGGLTDAGMTAAALVRTGVQLQTRPKSATGGRSATTTAITFAIWTCILSQKLALPNNIEVTVLVMAGLLAYLLITRRAFVSLTRLMGFTVLAAVMVSCQIAEAGDRSFSAQAMYIALLLYGMFVVVIPLERDEIRTILRRFQTAALLIAGMVGVDWAAQISGLGMPSMEMLLPRGAFYQSYNYIQPLTWQAAYMKPNGFFMLEASSTSQLLAIALVLEICLFQRLSRMIIFATAQLASFGGTGFVLLLSALLLLPFYVRTRTLVAIAGLALLLAAGASQTPIWKNFSQRSGEIGRKHSSGNGRFVEPYIFMTETMGSSDRALISGIGPGNGKNETDRTGQLVMNPVSKAVVEYGLLTAIVWMLFLHGCTLFSKAPFAASFVVIVQYDFLNGSLLMPISLAYCYLLSAAYVRTAKSPSVFFRRDDTVDLRHLSID
ncbi:hypothetical protein [Sphingomonas oryzagri]